MSECPAWAGHEGYGVCEDDMNRLPAFLTTITPICETLAAMDRGTALLEQETAKRNDQLSVSTAEEALSLWERDYSLADGTGTDTRLRRATILAAMVGGQTLTKERLAALAVTLGGADRGEVEEQFAAWRVVLSALYEGRLPEDTAPLETAVARLKPAHLEVAVEPVCRVEGDTGRHLALTGGMFWKLTSREGV